MTALHEVVSNSQELGPNTKKRYLRAVDLWIQFSGHDPAHWTRRRAAEFYQDLLSRMKPQSASGLMSALAYASRWWAYYEHRPDLDFAGMLQLKRADGERVQRALDQVEVTALLKACAGDEWINRRDLALFVVGLETGMRRMSLISMDTRSLVSGFDDPRWPYPAAHVALKGRSKKEWIPLSDVAVRALNRWLPFVSGPVFQGIRNQIVGIQRQPSVTGKPLSPQAIAHIFGDRAARAMIPHVHPHQLRHTFVTWRSKAGHQVHEVAAVTHHDVTKALGALGGYIDLKDIGGKVRNSTPPWLADLVATLA